MNVKNKLSVEGEKLSASGWMYRVFASCWTLLLWRKMEVITYVCLPETIDRNPLEKKEKKQQPKIDIDIQRERPQTTVLLFHRAEVPIPATVI